ncbi:MAG: hypothetical protein R6V48_01830, partial [Fidelibacterota bacterium]
DEMPWDKYDLSQNRRFNFPVCFVASIRYNEDGSLKDAHGMNASWTGDYTKEFYDWNFIEPQNDETNVLPGGQSITIPGYVKIYAPNHFGTDSANRDMLRGDMLIMFKIDEEGNVSYVEGSAHEDLIEERP